MKTNLTIFSVLIFCLTASLIIPKVADATGTFRRLSASNFGNENLLVRSSDEYSQGSQGTYVPPNYGGPDSQHGSGTR
ncbi:hypothetical protein [Nostoc sp. TCL26-01]|uniref:hypothetical protein n=1 Tax=Nostoc sp. TCL26-01 TaxID=2576904 RepID=UPI0015BCA7C3|nr:hypothetical protein [Nostoc sp. TCL26-01]QLE54546.1 hypothetical protein FD725_02855 [Nostoc sp. TCL26-01]